MSFGTLLALSVGMKTAITVWMGRISPVFDVAGKAILLDRENCMEQELTLSAGNGMADVDRLVQSGVSTLICGAISAPLLGYARSSGVEVIPFIAGDIQAVIDAWQAGELDKPEFRMPGCGRGRCCRRRNNQNRRR